VGEGTSGAALRYERDRLVARVPVNAMINAHDGVKCAVTDEEMNWFLGYFKGETERAGGQEAA
jgi:hypothetical protein